MATAETFIEKFSDIHPLPHVVTKLNNLIADNESTMKDFEEVIKTDPILVSRLLRLVNSPFYGLAQNVNSISRAVAFLGMKNLHNLAVTDALRNIFTAPQKQSIFSKERLWQHSAAVSICSKMVAERIFGINGDDALLCGILHDFGLLVEEQVAHERFIEICEKCKDSVQLVALEQEILGTDHCEIGSLLTKSWNMPLTIQEAIGNHHSLLDDIEPASHAGILQIAEFLAGQLGHSTLPEMTILISPPLKEHIQQSMDEYQILLEDVPEEMEKAQAIFS